jgi:protease-4
MEHQDPQASATWERAALEQWLMADVRERRATRRWRIARTLAWMLLLGALIWALASANLPGGSSTARHTAVVRIRGEIADGADASAQYVLPALREAMEDDKAAALVLLINSPGGSPVQAGLIYDEIVRLRRLHDKPIYAVAEDTCASAAYYLAAAADKIYVDKASVVGSIGVLMDGFGFVGTLGKLGIERRLLTAGRNKGFLDPFSPQSAAQKNYAQGLLDQIHQQFIAAVRQGRAKRLKESPDIFSGLFWTGEQAVQMGLADELGSVDKVAREVVKEERLVDYSTKANLAERLAKRFGASAGQALMQALRGLPGVR